MTDILSGVYENINSPIHNINVKYKIPCFLAMIILTLAAKSYVVYIIDFLFLGICILISKLNIKHFISAISKLWLFYLIIFLMNSLFFGKGETVLSLWKINITTLGIRQGAVIVLNVIFVILWSKLFVLTSSPIEITNAINFYLTPLKLFKVPTENLALILSVSIQFVPTLLIEAQNIKMAQIARGAEFESRNIFKRAKCIFPLIVPIFINAFKRADELSQALEARGYKGEK